MNAKQADQEWTHGEMKECPKSPVMASLGLRGSFPGRSPQKRELLRQRRSVLGMPRATSFGSFRQSRRSSAVSLSISIPRTRLNKARAAMPIFVNPSTSFNVSGPVPCQESSPVALSRGPYPAKAAAPTRSPTPDSSVPNSASGSLARGVAGSPLVTPAMPVLFSIPMNLGTVGEARDV